MVQKMKKQLKRLQKFKVGEMILAKLRGYPPWPAKVCINKLVFITTFFQFIFFVFVFFFKIIHRIRSSFFGIVYYGTQEYSALASDHFTKHADAQPIVDKYGRRENFRKAMEELLLDARDEMICEQQRQLKKQQHTQHQRCKLRSYKEDKPQQCSYNLRSRKQIN